LAALKARGPLLEAAGSSLLDVRTRALSLLGALGPSPETCSASERALGDAREEVRLAAVRGLPSEGGVTCGDLLSRALKDPARDVRAAALIGLGRALAGHPVAELAHALKDETDADRRYAAALALCRRGGAEVAHALDETARSGGDGAKLAATAARAFLGHPDELAGALETLRTGS
jgi:HEAT repeat protein